MKTYQIRSKVMKMANALKNTEAMKFGEAQRVAWQVVRCQEAMKKGEVFVRFFKEGQDVPQQRIGVAVTSKNYVSKNTDRKRNPLQITYFEVNSGKIKSFSASRFYDYRAVA